MKKEIAQLFLGKTVILGIGHPLRGDDACGPVLIERLQGRIPAPCFDGGSAPENYLGKIVKEAPDVILLIDAVDLGEAPGAYKIMDQAEILQSGFTTHDLSPRMMMEYLSSQTKAEIFLLGIQPQELTLGKELSGPVKKAVDDIERSIREVFHA